MIKSKFLALGFAVFLILGSSAYALEDRIIKSASELDYPPFSIVTDDGKAGGFSVELLRAALNAVGLVIIDSTLSSLIAYRHC